MSYQLLPPLPPDADWQPAPHFVPTEGFGVVPNFVPGPGLFPSATAATSPPPAEDRSLPPGHDPVGPPDPLNTLHANLDALIQEALFAARHQPSAPAGKTLCARVDTLLDEIAAHAKTLRFPPHRLPRLARLPRDILLALPDLLPVLRPARHAAATLLEWRARYRSSPE